MKCFGMLFSFVIPLLVSFLPAPIGEISNQEPFSEVNRAVDDHFYDDSTTIASLSKFDPRDSLTPVKDQGDSNLCWAYSAIQASEASILKDGIGEKDSLDLNPRSLAYRKYVRNTDPLGNNSSYHNSYASDWLTRAGTIEQTPAILSMWQGPLSGNKPATDVYTDSLYRLKNANLISSGLTGDNRIDEIKSAIAEYGAVTASCYYDGNNRLYYNDKAVTNGVSHAITLVGWDDTIDASLFRPGTVSRNGGWLVKNSYLDNPYFYLSYESKISDSTSYAFTYVPKEEYDYNYYYDNSETDFGLLKKKGYANVFQARKGNEEQDEYLEAVNVGFYGNDVEVSIKVYTGLTGWGETSVETGTLSASQTKTFGYGGYQTIVLDEPVLLTKGSYFSIVAEVSNPKGDCYISVIQSDTVKPSFVKGDSGYSKVFNGAGVCRIKGYTKCRKRETHVHDYGAPTYEWLDDDTKVKAQRVCVSDPTHIESETVETESTIVKEATCVERGEKRIQSKPFMNPAFSVQEKVVDTGYGDHRFSSWIDEVEPTFETEGVKGHYDCIFCHRHFDSDGKEIDELSIPKKVKMVRVSVIGGRASQEYVPSGTMVTITADPPKEGMRFVGFRDEKGEQITQDEVFSFFATEDVYLEAVYEKIEIPEPGNSNQPSLPDVPSESKPSVSTGTTTSTSTSSSVSSSSSSLSSSSGIGSDIQGSLSSTSTPDTSTSSSLPDTGDKGHTGKIKTVFIVLVSIVGSIGLIGIVLALVRKSR